MRVDFSRLPLEVRRQIDQILRDGLNEDILRAIETQRWAAARAWRQPPHAVNGLGPQTASINSFLDSCFRTMYGKHYTEDKDRMKWLLKEYPECAVRSRGTLRGNGGLKGNGRNGSDGKNGTYDSSARKFKKVYA